jgi:hypothetical protein
VLFDLNVPTGLAKLPPLASAPPIGDKNPVKSRGALVTVKLQVAVLPLLSLAVEVTVVTPTGNPDPQAGSDVTAGEASQLSVAVTEKGTDTSGSTLHGTLRFAGHVIRGFSVSLTVTLKEQAALLPKASVAVQATDTVPFGKADPEDGTQFTVGTPEFAVAVTV